MDNQSRQLVSSGSPYEPSIGFSRAVRAGRVVALSGTAPIGRDGKTVAPGDAATQARPCVEIIREALEEAGASLSDMTRTPAMLARIEDWEKVGQVHGEFFRDIRPGQHDDSSRALYRP